jgi:hypothetical protein
MSKRTSHLPEQRLGATQHIKEIGHHSWELITADNEVSKTGLAVFKWGLKLTKRGVDALDRKMA